MSEDTNKRLDRIENKVDKLADAMSNLVRLEERIHMQHKGMERLGNRVDIVESELKPIKEKMPLVNILLSAVGKVGITILLLITAGIVGSYFVFK